MSKIIRMTPEYIEQIKREFEEAITKAKIADGKISYTKSFATTNQKARLLFTEKAWTKMQALLREFDKEVAWHGVVERGENNDYLVSDILVYPQQVSAANVEMDTEEYAKWIQEGILSGDERYDHFYFQGHSHVNMGTTPSSVDLNHQEEILNKLRDTGFYVFVIWNKRNERNIKIYDLAKNTLFETGDVSVEVVEEEDGVEKFVREAKKLVRNKTYTPAGGYGGAYGGGYGGYNYPLSGGGSGAPYNPIQISAKPAAAAKPAEVSKQNSKGQKGTAKGKGKGKSTPKPKSKVVAASKPTLTEQFHGPMKGQSSLYDDDYDDEDDPTSPFYVKDDYWRY